MINIEELKAKLASVGESKELQAQKEALQSAMDTIDTTDFYAGTPSSLKSTMDAATSAITEKADVLKNKAIELAPKLNSLTEKMMEAVNDPSLVDSLQSLTDNLSIQPPGINLPNLGGGLDIRTSPLGNFDVGSALNVADVKLGEVGVSGFDSVLPDINLAGSLGSLGGAGALGTTISGGIPDSLISGATDAFGSIDKVPTLFTEGSSGALENPFKTFGNIQIKDAFDEAGNPIKEFFKKGVPSLVPGFDARVEPPAPDVFVIIPPDTTTPKLPKIYDV